MRARYQWPQDAAQDARGPREVSAGPLTAWHGPQRHPDAIERDRREWVETRLAAHRLAGLCEAKAINRTWRDWRIEGQAEVRGIPAGHLVQLALDVQRVTLQLASGGAASTHYPDLQNPNDKGGTTWVAPCRPGTDLDPLPRQGDPHVERTRTGRELPFCRRSGQLWQLACEKGHSGRKYIPCAQLDCRTCEDVVRRRRGRALYRRIGGVDLAAFVLTCPASWHGRMGPRWVRAMRKAAAGVVQDWARDEWDLLVGVHTYVHPEGDETPGVWLPHVHLQMPLLGLYTDRSYREYDDQREALDEWQADEARRLMEDEDLTEVEAHYLASDQRPDAARLQAIDPWLHMSQLADLRARWGRVLAGMAEDLGLPRPTPQLHYTYRRTSAAKLHRLQYDGRPFPAWYAGGDLTSTSLDRGVASGLLAPGTRDPAIGVWRRTVAGDLDQAEAEVSELEPEDPDEEVRQGRRCWCCAARPEAIAVVPAARGYTLPGPLVDTWALQLDPDDLDDLDDGLSPGAPAPAHPPPPGGPPDGIPY